MRIKPVIILFPLAVSIVCFIQLLLQFYLLPEVTGIGFDLGWNRLVLTAISGEFPLDSLGDWD